MKVSARVPRRRKGQPPLGIGKRVGKLTLQAHELDEVEYRRLSQLLRALHLRSDLGPDVPLSRALALIENQDATARPESESTAKPDYVVDSFQGVIQ